MYQNKLNLVKFIPTRERTDKKPTIYFSKAGSIRINMVAAKILEVDDGDSIDFYQDHNNPKDWYISKSDDSTIKLRNGRKTVGKCLVTNCSKVKNLICNEQSAKFLIGIEPVQDNIFAIITSKNLLA